MVMLALQLVGRRNHFLFWGANKEQNRVYSQDDDLSDVRYIEYGMELYKGIGSQERSGSTSFENKAIGGFIFD